MMRVVVLGGSGFVGSAIVAGLAEAGFRPVAVSRRGTVRCDATDAAALMPVLQGAHAVVNAVLGDADTMMAATRALAGCARTLDLRVVHLSSMAVYGPAQGRVDEAAPMGGTGLYAEAKIACETLLAGTGAVILRPGLVYGPGGEQWAGRIFRLLRARRLGDLGEHGDGRCNFIHARDLAAAVVALLARPRMAGVAINLAHGFAPRWNDVLVACARAIGAVPAARIAGWQLAAEARLIAPPLFLARLSLPRIGVAPARLPEVVTPSMRALFRQDVSLDCHRADRLLGLSRVPPAEGLAECAAWFLETYGLPEEALVA
jgi:nucleoside-diphosphate-sugar epimerase